MFQNIAIITSPLDKNARDFIDAAALTGSTQNSNRRKLNDFVRQLKARGMWSNVVSCHPYMGGTGTAHALNLVNVSTYQLTFFGSPTHGSEGTTFNGTTGYASTTNGVYYSSEILGTAGLTIVARVRLSALPNATNGAGYICNSIAGDGNAAYFELVGVNNTSNIITSYRIYTTTARSIVPSDTSANTNELYNIAGTYDGATLKQYKNGSLSATTLATTGNISTTVFDTNYRYVAHGARPASQRGSANSFLNGLFGFALVANRAFSDSEMSTLNTLINNLKT